MGYGKGGWEVRRKENGEEKKGKWKEQQTIEMKSHLAETPCKFSAFVIQNPP